MKVNSELKDAYLEKLPTDPPFLASEKSRMYFNTTDNAARINDGVTYTALSGADNAGNAPIGSIIPYAPGYFSASGNVGFTVIGPATNDVAGVNAYLPSQWRVCDGTELLDAQSPIFNNAGRFLPDLTDDRFLKGSVSAGAAGISSGTFTGNNYSYGAWFKNSNYQVALTGAPSVTFDTNSLDSTTYQSSHYHNSGPPSGFGAETAYRAGVFLSGSYVRVLETTAPSWSSNRYADAPNKVSASASYTSAVDVFGNSGSSLSGFVSGTYACSETKGDLIGSGFNIRDAFANAGSVQVAGTLSNLVPKYLNCFYIMRIK